MGMPMLRWLATSGALCIAGYYGLVSPGWVAGLIAIAGIYEFFQSVGDQVKRDPEHGSRPASTPRDKAPPLTFGKVLELTRDIEAQGLVQRYCLARLTGSRYEARKVGLQLADAGLAGMEVYRHLELVFDSLTIIECGRTAETVRSRLGVAESSLAEAHELAPGMLTDEHHEQLRGVVREAASTRLTALALMKIEHLQAKVGTAKTEPTRVKYARAVVDYARQAAAQPELAEADRAKVLGIARQ